MMASTRAADVLAEVFRTYGFDTTTDAQPEGMSRTTYDLALHCERDGMDVAVGVHSGPDALAHELVEAHARMVRDIGSFYGVLVSIPGFTEDAWREGARHKLILWDRPAMEGIIGRAVLDEVLGTVDPDLPIAELLARGGAATPPPAIEEAPVASAPAGGDPSLTDFLWGEIEDGPSPTVASEPMPPAAVATPAPAPAPAPAPLAAMTGPAYEEGRGWHLETRQGKTAPPLAAPAPAPTPAPAASASAAPARSLATLAALGGPNRMPRHRGPDPRVFNPTEGALLAPAVAKERAASVAREKTYTIDHTRLRYHPKRLFRWEVEAFVEGQVATRTLSGIRLIDLANRDVAAPTEWTPSRSLREGTFDVPVEHKPVRLDTERAHTLALESVLEETAREITVEDTDSTHDIMMTVKRRVRAHRDDVRLHDEGLHWCPVWVFTGVNGEVEVDALSGDVLGEQLKSSSGTTIML